MKKTINVGDKTVEVEFTTGNVVSVNRPAGNTKMNMKSKKLPDNSLGNVGVDSYEHDIVGAINFMTIDLISRIAATINCDVNTRFYNIENAMESREKSLEQLHAICTKAKGEIALQI